MPYTADRHYTKVYLQNKLQQPMKHICKCMAHVEFNIMQLRYVIFTNDKRQIYQNL